MERSVERGTGQRGWLLGGVVVVSSAAGTFNLGCKIQRGTESLYFCSIAPNNNMFILVLSLFLARLVVFSILAFNPSVYVEAARSVV